jgi:N-acetylmuramoyl-L-alanine amidase
MSRCRWLHGALLCTLTAICAQAQQPGVIFITDVRFWSLGETTRIAIEASAGFEYHAERIQNPDRIFFDIPGARLRFGEGRGVHTIPVGDARLKQIRAAQTQPGVSRIVLDVEAGMEFSASQLSNPDRLMIELRPSGARPAAEQPAARDVPARPFQPPVSRPAAPPPALLPAPTIDVAVNIPAKPVVSKPEPAPLAVTAKRNSSGDRTLTRILGLKLRRVVLDPGHGGHDNGTVGPTGLFEKVLVLDVAKRLAALIEVRLGSEVLFTRSEDEFVALEARTEFANQMKADLFLSIHANSSPIRSVSGAETFYLNFTTSRADLEVAARENASSEKSIYELKDVLAKIALKDKAQESREFAAKIQNALQSASPRGGASARNRGVKKAPFVVLIGASMPSVLAEIGFLSNTREEALLHRSDHRQRIAEALFKGVSQYAATLSHFEVAQRTPAPE